MPEPTPRRSTWLTLVPLALAAITFAAFLPALSAGFSDFDDHGVLLETDRYRGFAPSNLAWMFTTTHMGHYQPLTWLSYAIDFSLWGLDPRGFHLTGLLIHALNAGLVYLLSLRIFRIARPGVSEPTRIAAAAVAALLWSIHPLRVESVAWITERRDVLSGLFLLLTTLAYLRAFPPESTRPASGAWYVASVALLLLSLLSKAWGITFFVVALVLDWFPLRRVPLSPLEWRWPALRPVLVQKVPHLALGVLFAMQAARAQSSQPLVVKNMAEWGVTQRLCQAAYGLCFYLEKLVWPTRLAALYELPSTASPTEPRFLAVVLLAALGLAIVCLSIRRWPAIAAAAIIYAAILSPVLGLLQSGIQLVADRYSYLANVSWSVLIAGGALVWLPRSRGARAAVAISAAAAAATLSFMTWRQTTYWQDTERLFAHALAVGADGPILRENYGRQLETHADRQGALEQFDTSIRLDPRYGEAWYSRGNVLKLLGRYPEAIDSYQHAAATMADSWRADVALGLLFHELDQLPQARAAFDAAVRKLDASRVPSPTGRPYLLLAAVLDEMGDEHGSREMLLRAAQFEDTRAEAMQHMREPP